MKHLFCILLFLCSVHIAEAQVKYETIESLKLEEVRELKIQLPRGYNSNRDKKYPLFIVLDGDYMFEAVAGNVDYYSYWEDMPESIVVGVNQLGKRFDDCRYSELSSLPVDSGTDFFEFIGLELIPYIEKEYRTSNFRVVVGHGDTANFINYFLLKSRPLFQAYIAVSPELAPKLLDYVPDRLRKLDSKIFYYLANTYNDRSSIKKNTAIFDVNMASVKNENLIYNFDSFEGASHYSVPVHALPKAFEAMFEVYSPISKKEYKETILKLDTSPVDYLVKKYQTINGTFDIHKQVLINDFKAISSAIEKTEMFEYYEPLAKLARKEYPKAVLGSYYLARFYEETGEAKKAMRIYESAYVLTEIGDITKDLLLEKANLIKEDFGY